MERKFDRQFNDSMSVNSPSSSHPDYTNQSQDQNDRPFKDSHHELIREIWNVDRFNPKIDEKLKVIKTLLKQHDASMLCDILHDVTGQPIAQATPLLIACFEGDADVIKLIIEANADVNQTESEHHLTPLHVVCDAEYQGQSLRQRDRADIVKMLVKRNANVNHLDRSSMAAIHKAVIHDRPECVYELMEAQADPNVIYMGDTPLSIAARHNREKICRILLSYRETNINHRNDQGGTPLHFACAALVDTPACVELLIERGAKVDIQDHKKNTPAMVASFFNKPKILQFLIEQGADLSIKNNEDKDCYDVADEKDHYECRSVIGRYFERLGAIRQPASAQFDEDLAKNFDSNFRIK